MNLSSYDPLIVKLAHDVRRAIEKIDNRYIIKPSLCGACAIASRSLAMVLSDNGFKPVMVYGSFRSMEDIYLDGVHVWLEVDAMVVDITATQYKSFKNDPVVIIPSQEAAYSGYHADIRFQHHEEQFIKTTFRDWDESQFPDSFNCQKVLKLMKVSSE